jgi:hypothetical protein
VSVELDFAGFPIRLQGAGQRRAWLARLGRTAADRPIAASAYGRSQHSLTIEFVHTLDETGDADSRRLLQGDGFALDLRRRILYYPLTAPKTIHVPCRRRAAPPLPRPSRVAEHSLLARTTAFALTLLAESNGPASVGRCQAPLYLHASAVAGRYGALVFCGHSTFGKSTIARLLSPDCRQLEDDQAIILAGPTGRRAAAPPRLLTFGGPAPQRGGAPAVSQTLPVGGLFWLEKADSFSLAPMASAEAAALLLAPILSNRQPAALKHRLCMLHALLAAMPCQRLSFRRERGPLRALLREHGYV